MAAMNVHAQSVDQTQGVGGLVLDSLYSVNNKDQRTTKFVYEYNQARLPQIKWECSYIGQGGIHLDEPYIAGYDKYYYDEHDRQQKVEAYQESNGTFVVTYIEEVAAFDEATGLPSLIYAYQSNEEDPVGEPQLAQKVVVTQYHGNIGIEDMEVYSFLDGEWQLLVTAHNDYDDEGRVAQETISAGTMKIVTIYEYDEHGQMSRKEIQEIVVLPTQELVASDSEMIFTNEYYDDGNIKTSAEYDNGSFIDTTYYFWGNGVTTDIRQMQSVMSSVSRYYDMNGRPLNAKPTHEGIYLHNGKKLVVK